MPDDKSDPDPVPVPPPPIETAPSATGLVDGDENELREAPPSVDEGER
jgi:hypothetical protein